MGQLIRSTSLQLIIGLSVMLCAGLCRADIFVVTNQDNPVQYQREYFHHIAE